MTAIETTIRNSCGAGENRLKERGHCQSSTFETFPFILTVSLHVGRQALNIIADHCANGNVDRRHVHTTISIIVLPCMWDVD